MTYFFFFLMIRHPPKSTLFPYTPLSRSGRGGRPPPASRTGPGTGMLRNAASSVVWYRNTLSWLPDSVSRALSRGRVVTRSEEHTSELQSRQYLVCRLLLEKKKEHHNMVH